LSHIVSIEDVARLRQIGIPLMESDQLPSMLVIALQSSDLPAENIIQLLNDFNTDALLSAQQLVKIYLRLIEHHNWQRDLVHLLVEQVARQIQQHQEVTIAVDVLWQMLHIAGEGEIDIVDRVVTRRILTYVEAVEDDTRLVDMMIRLHGQQKKNSISNRVLLNWWREFAQQQPPPRLRNLNQLLQERRELEAVRAILTTSHAIKKAIGPHTLVEFAGGIDVAFTILQTLSDSFDPANRPELAFDRLTVQAELNAREDELDVDEQRVLAKNLRELAQLVAMMADFRSKPSMLRREEDIDRQLLNGEQAPHSAIDTMKWLSGYLNGTQNNGDGE